MVGSSGTHKYFPNLLKDAKSFPLIANLCVPHGQTLKEINFNFRNIKLDMPESSLHHTFPFFIFSQWVLKNHEMKMFANLFLFFFQRKHIFAVNFVRLLC